MLVSKLSLTIGPEVTGLMANACAAAQFVLRDQSAGEKQGVAGVALLGSRNRFAVRTDFCNRDSLDTVLPSMSMTVVAELQRDAEIIQTLYDVSLQTTGVRHQFGNYLDLRAFQRHAACHDQTNVTGT